MSLVVGSVDIFFCDGVALGSEHVELGVIECSLRVFCFVEALLCRLLLVGLLTEDKSFFFKLALKLSRLWVEVVHISELLAE